MNRSLLFLVLLAGCTQPAPVPEVKHRKPAYPPYVAVKAPKPVTPQPPLLPGMALSKAFTPSVVVPPTNNFNFTVTIYRPVGQEFWGTNQIIWRVKIEYVPVLGKFYTVFRRDTEIRQWSQLSPSIPTTESFQHPTQLSYNVLVQEPGEYMVTEE